MVMSALSLPVKMSITWLFRKPRMLDLHQLAKCDYILVDKNMGKKLNRITYIDKISPEQESVSKPE